MTTLSLAPKALYQEVAESLRQRIFNRELEPGSWIDEISIAQNYGISRTPLREALKVLAAEGLVTMKIRRGAYVTEVSDKDLQDVYHLLALLESDAAAVVAGTATLEEINSLDRIHQELSQCFLIKPVNTERFFQLNEQFHLELLKIANNKWRDQLVADLRKVMKLNRHHSLLKAGRLEQSLNEHDVLMTALKQQSVEHARSAMQTHFINGLQAAT
jgi:DNA-binding GntR family transcriptional regulator